MLSLQDLSTLLSTEARPAVSAFLPTHVAGREIRQDPIRLRNLLDRAQERLVSGGMRSTDAAGMLKPGYDLVDDPVFWRHQSEGLAVFVGPQGATVHKVPESVPEDVFVDDRFHIRPLIPALAADGPFIVMTITLKDAHLYEASRHGLSDVPVTELPRGTENLFTPLDALGEADGAVRPDDQTTRKPTTANASDAVAHSRGGSQSITTNDELVNYVTQLARAVERWLGGGAVPLVLIADERVAGHYQQANQYAHLAEVMTDHPDSLSREELHRRGYEAVRPIFERDRTAAVDRFRMLAGDGSGKGIIEPTQVVEAAVQGRVEHLFLREGAEVWGRWLPDATRAVTHHVRKDGDRELMELAAASVFSSDGRVHELAAEEMPADTPMAAVLRY